ncbi:MAG: aspartate kinase [Vampirovibrionales bacterium]|nr:aspartate kinase [Vampirovibrionales bacterium]
MANTATQSQVPAAPKNPRLKKPLIMQKFGGTSVGDAERIKRVARIIADTAEQGYHVAVVVSAMGHSTDHLVDLANQLTENPSGREYDALLATGEMVTTALMAMALNSMGYPAIGLSGPQAGIHTEDLYNRARILEIKTEHIINQLNGGKIVIISGFQGQNSLGETTTLGRGGSDTSAVALAGALGAERCDIYTDVRGVYSTDPRVVPEAVKLDQISYIEMMELARVGAQVLHPRAVELAKRGNVTLSKRSTFHLEDPGTMIVDHSFLERVNPVTGVASDKSQARLAIVGVPDKPGVAADIFGNLADANISVDMIIQSLGSEHSGTTNDIAFTIPSTDLADGKRILEDVKNKVGAAAVLVDDDIAKVSIVGAGMIDRPGIAADFFQALSTAGINIKMIATSEIKISCLVEKSAADSAVRAIHKAFFPDAKLPAESAIPEEAEEQSLVKEALIDEFGELVDEKVGY